MCFSCMLCDLCHSVLTMEKIVFALLRSTCSLAYTFVWAIFDIMVHFCVLITHTMCSLHRHGIKFSSLRDNH